MKLRARRRGPNWWAVHDAAALVFVAVVAVVAAAAPGVIMASGCGVGMTRLEALQQISVGEGLERGIGVVLGVGFWRAPAEAAARPAETPATE